MKKGILTIVIFIYALSPVFSQQSADKIKPVQISLFYPIGTSGEDSENNTYQLSLNIFSGITGSVTGIEIGSIVNVNKNNITGIQFGGIGNVTHKNAQAVQFGGIFNMVGEHATGFQAAGIVNVVGKHAKGIQVAGLANLSGGDVKLQASGFSNVSGHVKGAQLAGFNNTAYNVEGMQLAGAINKANYVKGFQLSGLINICDSIDGIPIAPVSIVKHNGYNNFEISSNELLYINFAYRLGVKRFYTFMQAGVNLTESPNYFAYGLGAGTIFDINNRLSYDIEAVHLYVLNDLKFDEYNGLTSLRAHFILNFSERLALFGGPSLNLLTTENINKGKKIAADWSTGYKNNNSTDYFEAWIGFHAGIRF